MPGRPYWGIFFYFGMWAHIPNIIIDAKFYVNWFSGFGVRTLPNLPVSLGLVGHCYDPVQVHHSMPEMTTIFNSAKNKIVPKTSRSHLPVWDVHIPFFCDLCRQQAIGLLSAAIVAAV